LIDASKAAGIKPNHQLSVPEARQATIARAALSAGDPESVGRVEDRTIPGPAGSLPVRLYWPLGVGPFPVLVYLHGGGWVCGTLDTHDGICRALTNGAGCLTISVDYRLAPEHKFPAAVEDAYAATSWAAANPAEISGDPARLAVGGDSAGGNLAAAVALMARDRGSPKLAFQLLIYPISSFQFDFPSYQENAQGFLLTTADMRWYWGHYLAAEEDGRGPYASPLQAPDLSGLPPALVITAEYDPLRDEGEAYAACLREAGAQVTSTCYRGMIHGFLTRAAVLDQGKHGLQQATEALRNALAP
jgi:acetyl esterase